MSVHTLSMIILASVALAGCATNDRPDMTGWAPEYVARWEAADAQEKLAASQNLEALNQSLQQFSATLNHQAQAIQAQAAQTPNYQIGPYGQPPSSSIYYCRDLTGAIVSCQQVR